MLLKFDIAGNVPIGATVDAATLTLRMNKVPSFGSANSSFGLHALSHDWSEGTVNASGNEGKGGTATNGSATWISTALNTGPDWASPGGSFTGTASASVSIGTQLGFYSWTSAALADDVQSWLGDPAGNLGWILVAQSQATGTARRFFSREATTAANRPQLSIDYTVPGQVPSYRETWLAQFYPGGDFPGDLSNEDDDQNNALVEYAIATDPTVNDDSSVASVLDPSSGDLTMSFVRDPRADDLRYTAQVSSDMQNWLDIATSLNGDGTLGSVGAVVTESNILGRHPLKQVVVILPTITDEARRIFTRLSVSRDAP